MAFKNRLDRFWEWPSIDFWLQKHINRNRQ